MSNEQGFFRAEQLPVGTYEVDAEQTGFALYKLYKTSSIVLSLGVTAHLKIVLSLASASERVSVSAQPSGIDVSQTSAVSTVDQERLEEMPVKTRNALDFVLLAPGVSAAPTTSAINGSTTLTGSGFTFGGLRTQSNNVSIDGLDNNDEYTGSSRTELLPEIVQEFQVVNNGLSAESGGRREARSMSSLVPAQTWFTVMPLSLPKTALSTLATRLRRKRASHLFGAFVLDWH